MQKPAVMPAAVAVNLPQSSTEGHQVLLLLLDKRKAPVLTAAAAAA
jgi:hypothetical protein